MVATLPCTVYLSEMKRSEGPGRGGTTDKELQENHSCLCGTNLGWNLI